MALSLAAELSSLTCSVISLRGWRTTALVACWSATSIAVWAWTVAYGTTTAQAAQTRFANPAPIVGHVATERPTLYLFMHPRCPCTRATIVQLDRVFTATGLEKAELPEVIVVVTIPDDATENDGAWRESDTVRLASTLPNAVVWYDRGGVKARSFGAQASGSVALYATGGKLLFAGGVTVSRGHEGDSLGAEQLLQQIQNPNEQVPVTAPALGCRLCLGE